MLWCMRTNVHLDEELLQAAMRLAGAKTKRAMLDQALRFFVERKNADRDLESYHERLKRVQAKTAGLRFEDSATDLVRQDRERE